MLHIFICEDDPKHNATLEAVVNKHISTNGVDMKLVMSASDPIIILDYLKQFPDERGLYFLDVDLQHEMNGIVLAAKIRQYDPLAKIVFITTHDELAYLTFMHKIMAMDYIIKSRAQDMEQRIIECIHNSYERYLHEKSEDTRYFTVTASGVLYKVPLDDILYFETSKNTTQRMVLYMYNGEIDFRGIISDVAKQVPEFYRCHKSFIVNVDKIVRVNKAERAVEMTNGAVVYIASRKMSELLSMIE